MALIDEIVLNLRAGRGGDGVVRWRHEKGKEFSGASGGNGGRGGDVYIKAVRDIGLLAKYRNKRDFQAGNGEPGMRDSKYGKDGEDLTIELPIGSIVTNVQTGKKISLEKEGETHCVLEGGSGGLGNEHFKASTNTTPLESTPGKEGEFGDFSIELQMFADAGLIGFPNAGKSSLLNALSRAKAKVANYQFTTLEPNLGDMEGFILADIPGLIEGASVGKGLGHKFLRHIRRTKVLLHCISLENENLEEAYNTVRKELLDYDESLAKKKEIIILTKTDLMGEDELKNKIQQVQKINPIVLTSCVIDDVSVKSLKDDIVKILRSL